MHSSKPCAVIHAGPCELSWNAVELMQIQQQVLQCIITLEPERVLLRSQIASVLGSCVHTVSSEANSAATCTLWKPQLTFVHEWQKMTGSLVSRSTTSGFKETQAAPHGHNFSHRHLVRDDQLRMRNFQ
jgi:hypothetical protein